MENQSDTALIIYGILSILAFVFTILFLVWTWRTMIYAKYNTITNVVDLEKYYRAGSLISTDPDLAIEYFEDLKLRMEATVKWIKKSGSHDFISAYYNGCDRGIAKARKALK